MIRWRINRVEAEHFMCWERLDWDLRPGFATLITGDRGTGRSNGAGKSTLFEAILWCLYGVTGRRLKSIGKVRRRHSEAADLCYVRCTVDVDHGDGKTKTLVIERSRSSTGGSVRASGLGDHATMEGTQAAIDALLGDLAAFTTMSMFTGELASFCRMTDADRKEMLERMAGNHRFEEALRVVDERLALTAREIAAAEVRVEAAEGAVARAREERKTRGIESMKRVPRILRELRELRLSCITRHEAAMEASAAVAAEIRRRAATEAQAATRRAELEDDLDEVEARLSKARTTAAVSTEKVSELRRKVREIEREIDDLVGGSHPDICSQCGQRWPHEHDPEAIQKAKAAKQEKIVRLNDEIAPLQAEAAEAEFVVEGLDRDRRKLKEAVKEAAAQEDATVLRRLMADALQAEAELAQEQRSYVRYLDGVDLEIDEDEIAEADRELEQAKADYGDAKQTLADLRDLERRLTFWKKGFGRRGLPSFLLDANIPSMNEVVTEVASALSDGELTVTFDPAAAKGNQSVFAVQVEYADGGDGFDASSRGERTRVDMAVLFALRDLAAKRGGSECQQLFLDEIMDGADEHFGDAFIRMLRTRYADKQVFLISHDPSMVNLCDRSITVKRKKLSAVLCA